MGLCCSNPEDQNNAKSDRKKPFDKPIGNIDHERLPQKLSEKTHAKLNDEKSTVKPV